MWLFAEIFAKSVVGYNEGGGSVNKRLRIKDLREDNDLTQIDVARILGTTPQYYQKYEAGLHSLPV